MALPPRQRVTPLNWQTPMVDPATGYPTPQFIRLWQQLFGNEEVTSAEIEDLLTPSGVTAGSYTNTDLTVDELGRITAAANGTSSSLAVEDDGVEIVAPATRLNFTGAGVTVTDLGSGEAEINIPGGGGGGGGVYTVVQRKIVALANIAAGITLDAAPSNGNLLIAIVFNATNATPPAAAAGWTLERTNTNIPDNAAFTRVAGVGETALQNPTTQVDGGMIAMYEISGATLAYTGTQTNFTATVGNINFALAGYALLPLANIVLLAYSGRRTNETPSLSGNFVNDLVLQDSGAIVGGTGLSVVTGVNIKSTIFTPTGTVTWPTSVASVVGAITAG